MTKKYLLLSHNQHNRHFNYYSETELDALHSKLKQQSERATFVDDMVKVETDDYVVHYSLDSYALPTPIDSVKFVGDYKSLQGEVFPLPVYIYAKNDLVVLPDPTDQDQLKFDELIQNL